tara:strand:- start:19532 stop:20995 length:1464 start_codon:yes stop_codon:yes gene_type:complete
MPYVGNPLANAFSSRVKQDLTGQSGTSFTLTHAVSSANDLSVYINHVRQEPTTAYSVDYTTLTTTGSVAGTDDFYIIYDELGLQSIAHDSAQAMKATSGTFTGAITATGITSSGAVAGTTGTFSSAFTSPGIDDNANATAITIDSAENIGIGTTPESHDANWTAVDFGNRGGLAQYKTTGDLSLSYNLYHDGAWKAKETAGSGRYVIGSGPYHIWYTGASANADAAVTLTERMRIDSVGNVGIGTTSPSSQYMTRLVVGDGSGTEGITIYSGNDSSGRLEFSDATSGDGRYAGGIVYEHNNNKLRFNTNGGNERLGIDSSGNVTINAGNLVMSNGQGIDFSANTASSVSGTSNQDELLDHYEEGYFTPTIYGSGGSAGSQQINGQEGRYVKIGKLVYITLYFYLQNGGAGSWSGGNRFGGFPFTNGVSNRQALSIGADGLNADEITFTISGSTNYGHVVDAFTGAAVNYSSFVTGYSIQMSGCYYTT